MVDLRCFDIADAGRNWIIRCRRCAAAWNPVKENYDPAPMIEHAWKHARRLARIEELRQQLAGVVRVRLRVELDVLGLRPATGNVAADAARQRLCFERSTYENWQEFLEHELAQAVADMRSAELRSTWREKIFASKAPTIAEETPSEPVAILPTSPRNFVASRPPRTRRRHKAGFRSNLL